MKTYLVKPYSYTSYNQPKSWGVWNIELGRFTVHPPMYFKKDAAEVAKSLNAPWGRK